MNSRLLRMSHGEPLAPAKPQTPAGQILLCRCLACAVVAPAESTLRKGETEARRMEGIESRWQSNPLALISHGKPPCLAINRSLETCHNLC